MVADWEGLPQTHRCWFIERTAIRSAFLVVFLPSGYFLCCPTFVLLHHDNILSAHVGRIRFGDS